jgi:penicillin-binding protein 1C
MLALLAFPEPPEVPGRLSDGAVFLAGDGTMLRTYLNRDEQWLLPWPEPTIPRRLEAAVLESEDRWFFLHPGVNPAAIVRAALQNVRSRAVVSGGSTITMQLARILDPKPRTVVSKLREIVQAIRIELRSTKREILAAYLGYAPYGGNVIGAPAAALRYFGKAVGDLTWAEAATLAVLPRAPGRVFPASPGGTEADEALGAARDRLLERLERRGHLEHDQLSASLAEPLPDTPRPFPFDSPHLTERLYGAGFDSGVVRTTIDSGLQREIERLAGVHALWLGSLGIRNLSILVAETESGRVRAYVGSQGYFDAEGSGAVDGVAAARSSGSILKPFLYALAIDDGLVIPETMMIDVPTSFGAFTPQNVDFAYFGMIAAREALARSLNVPAVRLLSDYGVRDFHLALTRAGMTTLFRRPDDYGLTLVLGGAETRLDELVALYRGLGRLGLFGPLAYVEEPGREDDVRLLSEGSASLVLDMLRELKRPGDEVWWERRPETAPIAWKTGTSYGNRDAWAVGVSPDWTVGVWVGNFDGEVNANLRSTRTSAPLLFDVFNLLPYTTRWFEVAAEAFRTETICLDTGYLAGSDCEHIARVRVPRTAPTLPVCPYHRRVFLSADRRHEVCSLCREEGEPIIESRLLYPSDAVQYLAERGAPVDSVPPHRPTCPAFGTGDPTNLSIIHPAPGSVIYLPRDFDGRLQELAFRGAHRSPQMRVFWYLDGRYLGESVGTHIMTAETGAGPHELLLLDEEGIRRSSRFSVVVSDEAR